MVALSPRRTSLVIALACVTFGCHTTVSSLKSRFATEQACPESEVNVTPSGGTQYHASGCKQSLVYVCAHASMSKTDVRGCAVDDARPPRSPPDKERPVLPPPDPRVQMP
jgi:hypothetical protein